MAYIYLAIAIAAEIFATSQLKYTQNFTKLLPSLLCIAGYAVCHYTFAKVLNGLQLGTAYAIWCGVGIVATSALSYLLFHEKLTTAGIFGILLILAGCVIVNLSGAAKV